MSTLRAKSHTYTCACVHVEHTCTWLGRGERAMNIVESHEDELFAGKWTLIGGLIGIAIIYGIAVWAGWI